jgi:N-acyl-D-aspartate/D-glutamate deacylase
MMQGMARENAKGAKIVASMHIRGTGILMTWRGTVHPFRFKPVWKELEKLPWAEQLAALKTPEVRTRMTTEANILPKTDVPGILWIIAQGWMMQYAMRDGFDYEPQRDETIEALAKASGKTPEEYAYDLMMQDEGTGFIYLPLLNYADGNLDFVEGLLKRDDAIPSLSDGGAHCGTICDAASPTYLLTHWVRDRKRGTVPLELAIKRQCRDTALLYGLEDRGLLAPGMLADVNVIDLANLKLGKPFMAFDLPAQGRRLLQRADGYVATIKSGRVTFRNGEPTGERPGRVVRGPQGSAMKLAAE